MKSYNEMANKVIRRINEYESEKRRKNAIIKNAIGICCITLFLIGIFVFPMLPRHSGPVSIDNSETSAETDRTMDIIENMESAETESTDLTNASPDERNWCESAVHMVYDAKTDGEEALAEISARVDLRLVGDTNADGKVNIRDATYIQKGIADIITMSETDMEVADTDDDLKVSVKDATYIQKKIAGIIKNSYEIGGSQYETN